MCCKIQMNSLLIWQIHGKLMHAWWLVCMACILCACYAYMLALLHTCLHSCIHTCLHCVLFMHTCLHNLLLYMLALLQQLPTSSRWSTVTERSTHFILFTSKWLLSRIKEGQSVPTVMTMSSATTKYCTIIEWHAQDIITDDAGTTNY